MNGELARRIGGVERWHALGGFAIRAAFAVALVILLGITWINADLLWPLSALLVGAAGALYLFRRPELNLYVTLGLFFLIMDYSDGLDPEEVFYGMYFMAFFAHWYGTFLLGGGRLLRSSQDWAIVIFVAFATLSAVWGIANGAGVRFIVGEAAILAMLGFYFPVRELCAGNPRAVRRLLYLVTALALFVTLRNVITYQAALSSAAYLFQVTTGRVALNEIFLMVPALGALCFLLYSSSNKQRLGLLLLFLLFLSALVLTQSRGYWAAFLVGLVALFLLTDLKRKLKIVIVGVIGLSSFVAFGSLLFPEVVPLVVGGLAQRFVSLGSAFSSDISMVNRLHETSALWGYIKQNPVIGYGMAAPFHYFDVIDDITRIGSFTHNAFVGLWFKFGIVGLALMMFVWVRSIWMGISLFRRESAPLFHRTIGLAVAVALIAELLVANTSTPFLIFDGMLMFTLLAAFASGATEYVRRHSMEEQST
jgi:O-antigen ligase